MSPSKAPSAFHAISALSFMDRHVSSRCVRTDFALTCCIFFLLLLEAKSFRTGLASVPTARNCKCTRATTAQIVLFQKKENAIDMELEQMEMEISGSINAKLDSLRISDALRSSTDPRSNPDPEMAANTAAPWQLAFAAAVTASAATIVATEKPVFAGIIFPVVFAVAMRDPIEEEGVAGPLARLLGRQTIKSVEYSKPKIQAIVRAAMTDKETIAELEQEIQRLREQNSRLELWRRRRIAVDDSLSQYTLDELKALARQSSLPVGGAKSQLMMRLVENGIIDVNTK